jgi:glycosyltransferase involved in cell wall biosynthesis
MKSLQLGHTDLMGSRFNGQDLHKELLRRGVESQHAVWVKNSDDSNTWQISPFRSNNAVRFFSILENRLSLQSVITPYSWKLLFEKRFQTVDIVHYHLIHTGFFNLFSLPVLTQKKPSVWTLHDPWAMTGHCVHPYECEKWQIGCGNCPNLGAQISMRKDRTALMWQVKKLSYHASQLDIVVASKWMLNMAKQSPLLSKARLHHIPFGLDQNVFRPTDIEQAKKELGVFPGSFVITFRATSSEFKGISFIKECLRKLNSTQPICLLTFNERGLVDQFRGRYQIIDLGWVNDDNLLLKAYNATDVFLMPSAAEAFGMMAMEAMACGKPVIATEGTALPDTIFAPEGGIAVAQGDVNALSATLERLINNPEERLSLGEKALKLAKKHYDLKTHVDKIGALYEEVIERRKDRSCAR